MGLKSHYFPSSGTVFQGLFWLLPLSVQTETQAWEDELTLFLFKTKTPLSPHVVWLSQEESWDQVTLQPSALRTSRQLTRMHLLSRGSQQGPS